MLGVLSRFAALSILQANFLENAVRAKFREGDR